MHEPASVRLAARVAGLVLGLAGAGGLLGAENGLTFPDAARTMRSAHGSLKAADAEVRTREDEVKAARGFRLPRVDLSASYLALDRPIEFDLGGVNDVLHLINPQLHLANPVLVNQQTFQLTLGATWTLLASGKVSAANEAAGARLEDARQLRRLAEEGLLTELVKRYFGLRLALAARGVRQDVLRGVATHAEHARKMEAEGVLSKAERLHSEVALAEADRQLKGAEQDVAIARAGLANLLTMPDGATAALVPASPLFIVAEVPALDSFTAAAMAENPNLGRLAAQKSLAAAGLSAAKGAWLPGVTVFGMREMYTADLTFIFPRWVVGAAATFPVFDGMTREHRIAAAKGQTDRVAELDAQARRDVAVLVEKSYRELVKAREQFDAIGPAVVLAEESRRVRRRAFEEGLGTSLEVVDAELSLSRVKLERLKSALEADVALASLLEASGQADRFEAMRASAREEIGQ
jgi:outer membrane protein TolC